jgi:hypothetical protein|tara:strand:+ start:3216 stop:3665 length:450 start_codon:yes stop_codon:yes gene_type:complete
MSELQQVIITLRSKPYYKRLMEILVINGLLDIFEEELKDGKIDYLPLTLNLLEFLKKNKKYYSNFSSDTFENIIILSIDEVLNKKFKIDLDEEQFKMVLQLVKNSYLFKTAYVYIKDILIKIYTKCKCRSCYNVDDVDIKLDISKHPNL